MSKEVLDEFPETVGTKGFELVHLEPGMHEATFKGIRMKNEKGEYIQSKFGYTGFAEFGVPEGRLSYALPLESRQSKDEKGQDVVKVALKPSPNNKTGKLILALGGTIPEPGQAFSWKPLLDKKVQIYVIDEDVKMKDGKSAGIRSKIKDVQPAKQIGKK